MEHLIRTETDTQNPRIHDGPQPPVRRISAENEKSTSCSQKNVCGWDGGTKMCSLRPKLPKLENSTGCSISLNGSHIITDIPMIYIALLSCILWSIEVQYMRYMDCVSDMLNSSVGCGPVTLDRKALNGRAQQTQTPTDLASWNRLVGCLVGHLIRHLTWC